jgi:hypothetical protein
MGQLEPPARRASLLASIFRVGKDRDGHWVAQDLKGLRGGLFVDRAQALKFALFENGNCRQAVIMVPGILELDLHRKRTAARHPASMSAPRQAA